MDQEPTMSTATGPATGRHAVRPHAQDAATLIQFAGYLELVAEHTADMNADTRDDLTAYAQMAREVAGMLMALRRTMREVVTDRRSQLVVPEARPGDDVVLAQRLLQGLRVLPVEDEHYVHRYQPLTAPVSLESMTNKPPQRYPAPVSIPDVDGNTVQVIPVYEPDAIPPELLRDGVPGSHLTGHDHGTSYDTEHPLFVRVPSKKPQQQHGPLQFAVWDVAEDRVADNPEKYQDATPEELVLDDLTARDADWWTAKLNQEAWKRSHDQESAGAGHDTHTDSTAGAR